MLLINFLLGLLGLELAIARPLTINNTYVQDVYVVKKVEVNCDWTEYDVFENDSWTDFGKNWGENYSRFLNEKK